MYLHLISGSDHVWLADDINELDEAISENEGEQNFAVHEVTLKRGDYVMAVKTNKIDVNDADKVVEFAHGIADQVSGGLPGSQMDEFF